MPTSIDGCVSIVNWDGFPPTLAGLQEALVGEQAVSSIERLLLFDLLCQCSANR